MNNIKEKVRGFIRKALAEAGHDQNVDDDTSLIGGGLLESIMVISLVGFIEKEFGIDFSEIFFDQSMFDTIDEIARFVEDHSVG